MNTQNLEHQVHTIESSVSKLGSQIRLMLFGLVVLVILLICAGAFAFGSLFAEVQQQKAEIAKIQATPPAEAPQDPVDF